MNKKGNQIILNISTDPDDTMTNISFIRPFYIYIPLNYIDFLSVLTYQWKAYIVTILYSLRHNNHFRSVK